MNLNTQQQQAVDHDLGPLLIVAGAGTGKTHVISSRIIDLINSGKATSDQVLALTFTEKAANEMVERIDLNMPLGYEEVCIKTFHSFCEKILRESCVEIGLDSGFKILSGPDQWFFMKKHLFEFELDYYRPLGNPNKFLFDLLGHFNKLKDELITPEAYIAFAEKLEGEEKEKTLEVARAYKKYGEIMIENNYLDFGDLIYYAIKLFSQRESVLKEYQSRYKYIMVDEFQDTNYSQYRLITLLAKAHKNLVVVGDDDQSIYKWRGASLSNILQFEDRFEGHKKIVLTENYRSSASILNSSYKLIQNNNPDRLEVRAGVNKKLAVNVDHDSPVEIHHFNSFVQETSFVSEAIKNLHDNEGVDYGQIAVLFRTNMQTHPFVEEFRGSGIPFQVKSPRGLLSLDEIKDLIAVIRVVANPYDDIALLRYLRMDIFDVEMSEILEILHKHGKEKVFTYLKGLSEDEPAQIPGMESGLINASTLLIELVEFSKKTSIGAVINEFMKRTDFLKYLVNKEMFEQMENINTFAKHISRFERDNEDNTVRDFVSYLDILEESNSSLPSDSDYFTDKDAVQILTVHGSKGLEFDYVFIVNTVNQRFPSSRRRDTFEIPEELTNEIYPEGDFHLQEERRLFYVAMTRARRRLFVTYSDRYEGNKTWKPSVFVGEIANCDECISTDHKETDDAIAKLKEFKEVSRPIFDLPPFKSHRLSYSQLDTFKMCPLKYSYRYMMKVPTPPAHAANFGTSVHETLNSFYEVLKGGGEVSLELMRRLYDESWVSGGYDNLQHEETRKEAGWKILEEFYEKNSSPWIIPAFLEKMFHVKLGDYLLTGRIDRIDKLPDGTYEVIDYKTGKLKEEKDLDRDLQLSIYALACKNVFRINVSKLSLYFLEDNVKISTVRTEAQLNELRIGIDELVKEIEGSDFSPTPSFMCRFCEYKLICPAV